MVNKVSGINNSDIDKLVRQLVFNNSSPPPNGITVRQQYEIFRKEGQNITRRQIRSLFRKAAEDGKLKLLEKESPRGDGMWMIDSRWRKVYYSADYNIDE